MFFDLETGGTLAVHPLKWGVRSPTQRLETGRTSAPGDTRQVRTHQTGVDHNLVVKTLSLLLEPLGGRQKRSDCIELNPKVFEVWKTISHCKGIKVQLQNNLEHFTEAENFISQLLVKSFCHF